MYIYAHAPVLTSDACNQALLRPASHPPVRRHHDIIVANWDNQDELRLDGGLIKVVCLGLPVYEDSLLIHAPNLTINYYCVLKGKSQ